MLSENIKKIRQEKGYTQKELADKVGISGAFMSLIEKGINKPSEENLQKIANALNVSVNELVTNRPSSPIEELLNLLINLTENEIIKRNVEESYDDISINTTIKGVTYFFGFNPYDPTDKNNSLLFENLEYFPKNKTEYDLFKRLYEAIMMFHNTESGIYKSISDLKALLGENDKG